MIENIYLKEWYRVNKGNAKCEIVKIFDIEYAHISLEGQDDIYVTTLGLPYIENLMPYNFWTDRVWFKENSVRLDGTSYPYKITTKKVNNLQKDIVVKWNRMGQEVPGAQDCEELMFASFNSPFEEFALVLELRETIKGTHDEAFIQKPLAIYVPSEQIKLSEIGRKEYKMKYIIESHEEVAVDMFRTYMVVYEWIPGMDISKAFLQKKIEKNKVDRLTSEAQSELKNVGFVVSDFKPHHLIVNPSTENELLEKTEKEIEYSIVDFELLLRTPEREAAVKQSKRMDYLKRQKDRFNIEAPEKFHPHMHHVNFFDVDYVYGHVESTKGRLWVLGKDPYLYDYFLPERWENIPKKKISVFNSMYYTVTKDNIHLAWKLSKVGLQPDMDPFKRQEKKILDYGFNSPFEEAAIAIYLNRKGIPTIYPRAIYMNSTKTEISEHLLDDTRFKSHEQYETPDKLPILQKHCDYISIWGYWNGPDEKLAAKDGDYFEGMNLLKAYREEVITRKEYFNLLRLTKEKLFNAGFEDLNFRGNHLLLSLDSQKNVVLGSDGNPEIRICNFEFLKKVEAKSEDENLSE